MSSEEKHVARKVCLDGRVWDLHIHTQSDQLKNVSAGEYVNSLCNLFERYPSLDLVSFTDHNCINTEAYKEFYEKQSRIALIPGIEVDVRLHEKAGKSELEEEEHDAACDEKVGKPEDQAKHLIVYFDAVNDQEKTKEIANTLNTYLKNEKVGPHSPIYIAILLTKLIDISSEIGTRFALSPHAMKQNGGKHPRGFDSDFSHLEHNEQIREASKYMDQLFCFWEAGQSSVAKAIEFLREIDNGSRVSVISFSDSKCLDDEKDFLDTPRQYFRALPSFNGLTMVGSECSRILSCPETVPEQERGNYLGEIEFDGQRVELSPQMNAIIGGRGKGKSILLDSIAYCLGEESKIRQDRLDFLNKHSVTVKSMGGASLGGTSFNCDFFRQNYILSLFEKDGEAFNEAIEKYFSDAFSQIEKYDVNALQASLSEQFKEHYEAEILSNAEPENIVGLVEKYLDDQSDGLSIGITKTMVGKVSKDLAEFSYSKTSNDIHDAVIKKLPKFLKGNADINRQLLALESTVAEQAHVERLGYLGSTYLKGQIYASIQSKKSEISKAQEDKQKVARTFEQQLQERYAPYSKRVALINAYIAMSNGFKSHKEGSIEKDGEQPNAFQFARTLYIENPLDCLVRILGEAMQVIDRGEPCSRSNLWKYINAFCFGTAAYKSGKTADTVVNTLESFSLNMTQKDVIRYSKDGKDRKSIENLSPGTQTNILLEYIVHKGTSIPLLIDQPEDNVDNQTIYSELRRWFKELKSKRQVVVVTHDANIVINADAENVVIADHPGPDKFTYSYGALEYGDIIDKASVILDGGPEAVKRRLVKYGS